MGLRGLQAYCWLHLAASQMQIVLSALGAGDFVRSCIVLIALNLTMIKKDESQEVADVFKKN
ncbi:hypothetical protein [Rhizosphaericola mali]|uniref:Uncharacterized protein n=1 Tax=Rhizosphaericola mali TaxID=2545455 RepID=A0A5P2FXD3_9BACT|nr:hypothetical protein [Rhizosphaericola mali]QES87587.1 hypothetical protein E0W69_002530 [Rhizosphaericola mali]